MNAIQQIIEEVKMCTTAMDEIKSKFDLDENHNMNLLWWSWHEKRNGIIRACEIMGIKILQSLDGKFSVDVVV